MSQRLRNIALAASVLAAPSAVAGQTLERRVSAASDGPVQFHFASREGVCGNGHSFMRSDENGYSFNMNDGNDNTCARGPVRVVVVRAGKEIIKIETYAGPLVTDANGGQDLGAVPAREASSYLLGLAATLDGRPARDAVFPAMLGDSVVVTPQLLQLAKDQGRSRDLRSSAISWLARRRSETGGVGTQVVGRTLDQMVRDRNENESVRRSALSTISSRDRGEGIPILIGFASDADTWLSKQSFESLSISGDPRARTFIRQQVRRADLAEDSRLSAIRGVGNSYANGEDSQAVARTLFHAQHGRAA